MKPYESLTRETRERIHDVVVWVTVPPFDRDFAQTIAEIAQLETNGLSRPADLVFHEVWLDDDPKGRAVLVYGKEDSPHYFCRYEKTPEGERG